MLSAAQDDRCDQYAVRERQDSKAVDIDDSCRLQVQARAAGASVERKPCLWWFVHEIISTRFLRFSDGTPPCRYSKPISFSPVPWRWGGSCVPHWLNTTTFSPSLIMSLMMFTHSSTLRRISSFDRGYNCQSHTMAHLLREEEVHFRSLSDRKMHLVISEPDTYLVLPLLMTFHLLVGHRMKRFLSERSRHLSFTSFFRRRMRISPSFAYVVLSLIT